MRETCETPRARNGPGPEFDFFGALANRKQYDRPSPLGLGHRIMYKYIPCTHGDVVAPLSEGPREGSPARWLFSLIFISGQTAPTQIDYKLQVSSQIGLRIVFLLPEPTEYCLQPRRPWQLCKIFGQYDHSWLSAWVKCI